MGGTQFDDDWDLAESSDQVRTIVLVGRAGNGKSATGNSILGRKAFKSRASSVGVTSTCEMQRTVSRDGQVINVIDTPGLFDFSMESNFVAEEIVNCIRLAKNGIHAVLLVFSVRTRFTKEEQTAIQNLQSFFGPKIVDYMIIVFTGGDELENDDQTLDDYFTHECPAPIKEILQLCRKRLVVFNNRTDNQMKKAEQVQQLLALIDEVVSENDGKPYSDDLFAEFKGALKLQNQEDEVKCSQGSKLELVETENDIHKSYEEQLKRITEMVDQRLGETILTLQHLLEEEKAARLEAEALARQQLEEEKTARLKAEEFAKEEQTKSTDEIHKLRKSLESAQKETEMLREAQQGQAQQGKCVIL